MPPRRLVPASVVCIIAVAWLSGGCASLDHATSIGGDPASISLISKRIWLAPVTISDTSLQESAMIAEGLTLSLKDYLLKGYASEVAILPGKPAESDTVLRLDIDHWEQRQGQIGPGLWMTALGTLVLGLAIQDYSLITAGLAINLGSLGYALLGLPVVANQVAYSGTLRMEDHLGRPLSVASTKFEDLSGVSMYSAERVRSVEIMRTRFVAGLLQQVRQSALGTRGR